MLEMLNKRAAKHIISSVIQDLPTNVYLDQFLNSSERNNNCTLGPQRMLYNLAASSSSSPSSSLCSHSSSLPLALSLSLSLVFAVSLASRS